MQIKYLMLILFSTTYVQTATMLQQQGTVLWSDPQNPELHVKVFSGPDVQPYAEGIAQLRMRMFA